MSSRILDVSGQMIANIWSEFSLPSSELGRRVATPARAAARDELEEEFDLPPCDGP